MEKLVLFSFLACIFSCQYNSIDYSYPENPENIRKQRAGKFFDGKKAVDKIDKRTSSSPLWVASIEIIGALLPIATIDQNSGLIITEWYQGEKNQSNSQSDRIKINLLVKGREPKKENLVLTIFRQTKNDQAVWVDELSDQSLFSKMIKDKIIEKSKSN